MPCGRWIALAADPVVLRLNGDVLVGHGGPVRVAELIRHRKQHRAPYVAR
jgi:hypothetical protein